MMSTWFWLKNGYDKTFGAFLFLFLFLSLSLSPSPSFPAPSLHYLKVSMIFEEKNHFFRNFFSNGFNILVVDAYSRVELCTPTWLNHEYGDGRVADIFAVDTYDGVDVCAPILVGEASN
jgi:hypothetical protein